MVSSIASRAAVAEKEPKRAAPRKSRKRRLFHSLFAFEDQKEGMAAFWEKRAADFSGR